MFIVAFDMNGRLIYTKRLTRRHYYHVLKIDAYNKRVLKWNKSLQDLYFSLSQHNFKTTCPESISSLLKIMPPNIMQFGKGWVGPGSGDVVNCTCTSRRQKQLIISFILSRSSTGIQLLPRRELSSTRFEEERHTIMITMSCCMVQEIFRQEPRVKGMYL